MHKTQDKTLSSPLSLCQTSLNAQQLLTWLITWSCSLLNSDMLSTMYQALCMGVRNQRATQEQKQGKRYTQNKIKEDQKSVIKSH